MMLCARMASSSKMRDRPIAHRLFLIALLLPAMISLAVVPARSAEFKLGATPGCEITLDGRIEAGDADRLAAALDVAPLVNGHEKLCLNSPGGNYGEGLRMIELLLKRTNVATVVERGAQCFSACAFLFLAGNTPVSEDGELAPDRTLDVGAILGFHAPYMKGGTTTETPEANADSYRRGVQAIARMLEIDRREIFPRGLLAKALQVGPEYLLYVDTVEKAGVWSIKLKGYLAPDELTDAMLDQACRNKDIWRNYSHSFLSRPADDPDELHGIRQSDFPEIRGSSDVIRLRDGTYRLVLDLFGYEATNNCVVDVYRDAAGGIFLSLAMLPVEQSAPPPSQFAEDVSARLADPYSLELIADPIWYVFAPNTELRTIKGP